MNKETTLPVPLALQNLILSNNALLKNYQAELMGQISDANMQMMAILQLNEDAGWKLDMNRMVYVRQVEGNSLDSNEQLSE